MLKYRDKNYVCHLDFGLDFFRGKWKAVILCHLQYGAVRFLELQRRTKGITKKILREQLKALEDEKLISRIEYNENPPRVEYILTEKGKELIPILEMIENWGKKYIE